VALVGYARVSTRDQHPEAQTDALAAAGCEKTFTDHASGTLAQRPALDEALGYLRAGDTLVVTKLDRLGRSVRNLKQVADDLQARQVGLRAVSQGIDTTTPGGTQVRRIRDINHLDTITPEVVEAAREALLIGR